MTLLSIAPSIDQVIGDPFKTRLVFLGDLHIREELSEERGRLLDLLSSKPKGIVLLERAAQGKQIFNCTQSLFTKKEFHFTGWERPHHLEATDEILIAMAALQKKNAHASEFPSEDLEKWGQLANKLAYFSDLRTLNMVEVAHFCLKNFPKKKIFVIAGQSHLYDKDKDFNVLNLCKTKKAALILFKGPPIIEQAALNYNYLEKLGKECQQKQQWETLLETEKEILLPPPLLSIIFSYMVD